jgi:hypothetical protein
MTMPRTNWLAAVLAVLVLAPAKIVVGAQVSIGAPTNNLISGFGSVPAGGTATVGQSFKTPDAVNTVLNNFTFYLTSSTDLFFRAYVYAWDDPNRVIVGPALFISAILQAPTDFNCARCVSPVSFNTGNLQLTPGTQYVAFLNTSGLGGSGYGAYAVDRTNSYADGYTLFSNNDDDFSALSSEAWAPVPPYDAAFNANFSSPVTPVTATPEPATLSLLSIGLVGLARRARRQRVAG